MTVVGATPADAGLLPSGALAVTVARDAEPPEPRPDLFLVQSVRAGSLPAWHDFVHRYSRLIWAVLRQQLPFEDDDERRSAYADILHELYHGGLADYRGLASLSTWLVVFVRGRALDRLRKRKGRPRTPSGYVRLTSLEKRVFQLYFVEWLPLGTVMASLDGKDGDPRPEEVAEALRRIEATVDPRFLRRCRWERDARNTGAATGRQLEYSLHTRAEQERMQEEQAPDHGMMARERAGLVDHVRALASRLPQEERRVLHLRYEEGLTAAEIAERTGLGSNRRVYTVLDRALRQLRAGLRNARGWLS